MRREGAYRLHFSLFQVPRLTQVIDNQIFYCASVMSQVFTVYPAKRFPGMQESTPLSRLFAAQGLKIRIRKDSRKVLKGSNNNNDDDDEEQMDEMDELSNSDTSVSQESRQNLKRRRVPFLLFRTLRLITLSRTLLGCRLLLPGHCYPWAQLAHRCQDLRSQPGYGQPRQKHLQILMTHIPAMLIAGCPNTDSFPLSESNWRICAPKQSIPASLLCLTTM